MSSFLPAISLYVYHMKRYIFLLILAACWLSACVREPVELELSIEPSALVIDSGDPLTFTITGQTDPASSFLTFYDGTPSGLYENYPEAIAFPVAIPFDSVQTNFEFEYAYNYHGPVTAVFIARGYGNWADDIEEQIFEFDI